MAGVFLFREALPPIKSSQADDVLGPEREKAIVKAMADGDWTAARNEATKYGRTLCRLLVAAGLLVSVLFVVLGFLVTPGIGVLAGLGVVVIVIARQESTGPAVDVARSYRLSHAEEIWKRREYLFEEDSPILAARWRGLALWFTVTSRRACPTPEIWLVVDPSRRDAFELASATASVSAGVEAVGTGCQEALETGVLVHRMRHAQAARSTRQLREALKPGASLLAIAPSDLWLPSYRSALDRRQITAIAATPRCAGHPFPGAARELMHTLEADARLVPDPQVVAALLVSQHRDGESGSPGGR